jgi:precorrin-2/cobalt-factor-2 C20-methyltransferase
MAVKEIMSGTLYGVGVGPGDPELMTVKAWRLIATAKTIAYLAANGGESTARAIAAPFIDPSTDEIAIDMPMRVEREPAQEAYNRAALQITQRLAAGQDVVFLCEGDPFFYGSFIYVFERLKSAFPIRIIPGVTSFTASAASIGQPLCQREEVMKIIPATLDEAHLTQELQNTEAAAIIKVGRHFAKVRRVLAAQNLSANAHAVIRATLGDEQILSVNAITTETLPYFTTIITRRNPIS